MKTMEELCRICLKNGTIYIFNGVNSNDPINKRIMDCASVEVRENDGLPTKICTKCLFELDLAYRFRKRCKDSEKVLQKYLTTEPFNGYNEQQMQMIDNSSGNSGDVAIEVIGSDTYTQKYRSDNINSKEGNNDIIFVAVPSLISGNTVKSTDGEIKSRKKIKVQNEIKINSRIKKLSSDDISALNNQNSHVNRKYICTICGKKFVNCGNLLDHERIHSGEKPYTCKICDRSFSQSGHLLIHIRTHSGVKPYQCEHCPKAFTISHALKKHLRTHTGERPYICAFCNKAFVTSYHLSNHNKRHTGDKKFKCDWPGCQLTFVNVSEMKRHKVRHDRPKKTPKAKMDHLKILHLMPSMEPDPLSSKHMQGNRQRNDFYLDSVF